MHDSLTILGHEFLLYGREFPPMEDRRSEGEHWNIFRQHHRGIVRMKFSRTDPIRLRIPG